jgi:hypothetical protein
MSKREQLPEALLAAIREIAAADAPELLAQVRSRARSRAAAVMEDALVSEMLEAAGKPPSRPRAHQPAGAFAWWAYCVLTARDAGSVGAELEGVEPDTRVQIVTEGELAALVSEIPLAEYDDERLRAHLEDLSWVERVARAHEAVLDAALSSATIVPLRLCTIYRDLDGVRRLLAERSEALAHSLTAVDRCEEWGVKAFVDPRVADEGSGDGPANAPSGAAYLARKREERDAAVLAAEARALSLEAIDDRLRALSRAAASNPPQRPEAHGRDLEMVLNAAYLVERQRSGELREAVAELAAQHEPHGLALELTGPWPAYNFVSDAAGVAS